MLSLILQEFASPSVRLAVAALYLLVAASVTMDVLLTKSDVRASLGWIAAAWLSPFLGGVLYFLFGINRVTRRAIKLTRRRRLPGAEPAPAAIPPLAENIARLCAVAGRVTGGDLTGGNRLVPLEGGDHTYPQMLAAIAGARRSIALASYIFRDDETGREFAGALEAAAARGIQVRVLLDSIGAGYVLSPILLRLRRGGVKARRFLHTWLPWRMPFLNMRNHRKLLVVDGGTAFVGGMNIGAENCSSLQAGKAIGDVHFRVEGPAVRQMLEVFTRDWFFTTGELLEGPAWQPETASPGDTFVRGLSSGPDADLYKLEQVLGTALALARERVRIVTPYFLPDARLHFALTQAALRGVVVEIILPERSDQRLMDWAMAGHIRFFRHAEVRFLKTPPPFDHAKLATIDGEWCLIGSSNWDVRSLRLNFEFDLECYGAGFTAAIDAIIDRRAGQALPVTPEDMLARPLWARLRDASARLLLPYL
jgi:cardiolipin synthase